MDVYESVINQPVVKQFLNKYQLDPSFVRANLVEFLNWIEAEEKCQGCQGLSFCRQRFKGCVYRLDLDESDYLIETYKPCDFQQKQMSALSHRKQYLIAHMDVSDYLIDLMAISLNGESQTYLKVYGSVVDSISNVKGLYIYGQAGTGKSYLMKGLCNYYAKKGYRVSFVKVPLLVREIKESFGNQKHSDYPSQLRKSEIVVFDDLGSESMSTWSMNDILFPILDYRMEHQLKTYFTSNYPWKELERRYANVDKEGRIAADRMMERIRTLGTPVLLSGNSRR